MRKKLVLILIILLATVLLSYQKYRATIYEAIDTNDSQTISFQIKKGQSVKEIAKNLEEKGLIKSDFTFSMYARLKDIDSKILAGRFLIAKSMNVPEILTKISDPTQAEFIITIQEGLPIKKIEQKLIDLELAKKGEFLNAVRNFNGWGYYDFLDQAKLKTLDLPLEGYIYPDTYFLDPSDFKPDDLIYLALDNFENKWNMAEKTTSEVQKNYSTHEIVTMASIIENEIFGEKDRKIVAGILWKRLKNGWMIGADATLLYITNDRTISSSDLALNSPYNTRKNAGLPPGPISNPSLESINAALNPSETNYWFYLTTPDTGEVIYAKTNEEHNANRAKYL